jgi:hypothetical protein
MFRHLRDRRSRRWPLPLSLLLTGIVILGALLFGVSGAIGASSTATLDQCANGSAPSPNTDGCNSNASDWVSGNLGSSKAVYLEGDSVPYRLRMTNLSPSSHTVTIEWDTTKSGKHALDYLTTFNRTVANANPCLGVTNCGSPSTFAIPADPQVVGAGHDHVHRIQRQSGARVGRSHRPSRQLAGCLRGQHQRVAVPHAADRGRRLRR